MLHKIWPFLTVLLFSGVLASETAWSSEVSKQNTTATQQVISDQLEAFKQADHARAYSHAASTIKGIFRSTNSFVEMVKRGYPAIYNSQDYFFGRNRIEGDSIFQEVLITGPKGKQWQAVYTLRMQDGIWKITGVQINPDAGAST